MKITLIELDLWCSMVIHQSALTSILDFSLSSEVVIIWQTDDAAHKLKPRSFYKSILVDFHSQCKLHLTNFQFGLLLKLFAFLIFVLDTYFKIKLNLDKYNYNTHYKRTSSFKTFIFYIFWLIHIP